MKLILANYFPQIFTQVEQFPSGLEQILIHNEQGHWTVVSNSKLMEKEVGITVAETEETKSISVSSTSVTLPVFQDLGFKEACFRLQSFWQASLTHC